MSNENSPVSNGQRLLLGVLAAGVMIIFLSSIFYRLDNPGPSTVTLQEKSRGGMGSGGGMGAAMEGEGSMGGVPMEMMRALMKRLEENPNDIETHLMLAQQFMQMRAWDKAITFLETALSTEPGNTKAMNLYAIALFQGEKPAEAAQAFEQLVAVTPDDFMARYNLGVIYGHYLDDNAKAREQFETILSMDPQDEKIVEMVKKELADH